MRTSMLEGSFPWGKSAYNGIATETVTYSYVDTPEVMIQLQEGPQFGLCDVTNGNGEHVTMPTTSRVVGEKKVASWLRARTNRRMGFPCS